MRLAWWRKTAPLTAAPTAASTPFRTLLPLLSSTALLGDRGALQRRMAGDGYLYFPGLLDVSALQVVRTAIGDVLQKGGWIKPGTDPLDAAACPPGLSENDDAYWAVYNEIQKLEAFHALAHHPALLDVMRHLIDEPILIHPLCICRIIFPGNMYVTGEPYTTPAHQDYPNSQGTTRFHAAWVPLGPCPAELGGLAVLRGSHRFGVLPMKPAFGPGQRVAIIGADMAKLAWHGGAYGAGDVLVFHSLTVHSATDNRTQRLRVSVDYRYQAASDEICEISMTPHGGHVTWEQVYSGWRSNSLQYYWEALNPNVVPLDYHLALPWLTDEEIGRLRGLRGWDVVRGFEPNS